MYELILTASLASIGISVISAPLGCVLLWQRLAFLGDTISHASLLGVAIAIAFAMPVMMGVFLIVILIAYFMSLNHQIISNDTFLAITAASCMAIAMLFISKIPQSIDLENYLFGDILAVDYLDILIIYGLGAILFLWLCWRWRSILLIAINEDLAQASGINSKRLLLEFRIVVGCVIGLAMKVVGILLISSLLIIPAATARNFSKNPEQMALLATLFSVFASVLGILLSFYADLILGPVIIVLLFLMFSLSFAKSHMYTQNKRQD
jgi:zinc transport system permease protein